jgi:predicted AAA+ superfamily ATPase
MAFLRLLRAAAARTGRLLNMAEMARDADVVPNTAKKWLSILQASGLIYLLEPYFNNVTKRLVKSPKLYFLDTGRLPHRMVRPGNAGSRGHVRRHSGNLDPG